MIHSTWRYFGFLICLLLIAPASAQPVGPWATYRGNPQRTGNTDGKPGPAHPKVLWVMPARDHFIASPVPADGRLYVSGLGAFNVATFYCLSTDPAPVKRVLWSRSAPYLKLPIVSSPGLAGDRLVFGDGMHQTDGATLYCLNQKTGMPLWQLPLPGKLIHLEGSPTIAGQRVYIGGGAAGVLCVDLERVLLEGKEISLPALQKILDQRWKELLARYEEQKKKDPDLALPPSADDLPHASPRRLWQRGEEKWHVDAPVAVAGDRVLAASAFLDKEKVGERLVACLNAKTGELDWSSPRLRVNPWGGPSVLDNLVVATGSTIGFDLKELKRAKGQIVALELKTGKLRWDKSVPGGIVSCAALAGGLAITTATDGKVRAFALADGERKWIYDAHAPFFAPPAAAGGVVYAGDLRGVVHAVDLKTGQVRWTLDVGKAIKAPGMIYGGPVVHGGRLYVATCNLDGSSAGRPTAVVCLGE
jgi:outer membrane protein assembly factor BamB